MNVADALQIDRIDHVSIIVTDVELAIAFYIQVLGMKEIPRPESFDFPGAWLQTGRNVIHLLGKSQPDAVGARHFCIWVADVQKAAQWVAERKCEVVWDIKYKIPGVDRFFTKDPDGNRIEVQGADGKR